MAWDVVALQAEAIITDKKRRRMVVRELTRGMAEDERGLESRMEMTQEAYYAVLVSLRHEFPQYKIHCQAVVLGILTGAARGVRRTNAAAGDTRQGDKGGGEGTCWGSSPG